MINTIQSSIPSFKKVTFNEGMNILVTEKTEDYTTKNTRNGSGKSSILEIIHFLLASSVSKDAIFKHPKLNEETFKMEFTLKNVKYRVERCEETKSKIILTTLEQPFQVEKLSTKQAKEKFAKLFFNVKEVNEQKISFRTTISYFLRQESVGGFLKATEIFKRQQKISWQTSLTFLLGLNTDIPNDWKAYSKELDDLKKLKSALKKGTFNNLFKTEAEIISSATILEEKINIFKKQIANFEVLPKYKEFEAEANKLTTLISNATNASQIDHLQISDIKKSLEIENAQLNLSINDFYNEVNLTLPGQVVKRLEEVEKFHESVISNRRNYLTSEITELKNRITERDKKIKKWSDRKKELMLILKNKGALDQFSKLQENLSILKAEFQGYQKQLELLHSIDQKEEILSHLEKELQGRLSQDFADNDLLIRKAILSFSHAAKHLYGSTDAARLIIDKKGKNGIDFEIVKSDQKSKGINNMMIFCFDMMLMEINQYLERPLDFIIHDSHLFDGVDERQILLALEYAREKSKELKFQYITMLNSDVYNSLEGKFENNKLDIDITDANENGGIFGFRF